jgi:tetratricopeptide (TPR) repeat protein
LSAGGDTAGALENYERALASRQQVATADPHDANAADAVARAHLSIGHVLQGAGRVSESIPRFNQALDILAKRHAADPANGFAAERLANALLALATAHAEQASRATSHAEMRQHWEDARGSSRRGLEIWKERAAKGPLSDDDVSERDELAALAARADRELAGSGGGHKP